MKTSRLYIIFFIVLTSISHTFSQKSEALLELYDYEFKSFKEFVAKNATYKGDTSINVKFYNIDIEIGIESPFVGGSVLCRFEPLVEGLNTIRMNLNSSLTVDSISAPCESFYQENDEIVILLENNYNPGDLVDITTWYHGIPVLAGGYKGLRYELHDENEPIIATLSTPYLAHYWYPCKDGPEDKADSVYMNITIPDTSINGIELIAVSNGLLEDAVINGDKKKFLWRHRYPIVTYYVMAAISNFVHFQDVFNGTSGESFPLDYYVFEDDLALSQQGVEDMPEVIQFFTDVFGTYPFSNEKYGMTQLGFYGAIENQTNTITNNMMPSWFDVSVHELAHMWFGDMITCADWHHGWLNEGFATYAEALWAEHENGFTGYQNNMANNQFWQGGTLYLQNAQDTFNIFQGIIYAKGAYVLHMLRGLVGEENFFTAITDYSHNPDFMYKNATTEDLQEVFEMTTGLDLDFFFEQWVYDAYYPFYNYNYMQGNNNTFYFVINQIQEIYNYRPVFAMPVPLKFHFTGGGDTNIVVWNDLQIQDYTFEFSDVVASVEFDPDLWILRKAEYNPDLPVQIKEFPQESQVRIFPNPVKDLIYFSFTNQNLLNGEVFIFDSQGSLVHRQSIPNEPLVPISLSNIKTGNLFYTITFQGKPTITGTFILLD
jgi:aminopeptidase N